MSLWDPVVPLERQHPSFKEVRSRDAWLAARRATDEVFLRFPQPDPNFVEQFQTTGFDQRVWELALFAGLEELIEHVDRVDERPDFRCVVPTQTFFVECTTAAPTQGPSGPPAPAETPKEFFARIREQGDIADDEVAIKLGRALYSKLKKGYEQLPHVTGFPLVLAIEAFFKEGSLWKSNASLISFLYGLTPVDVGQGVYQLAAMDTHTHEGRSIPSGFLMGDDARPISAIIFSNAGTISKFSRMGTQAGMGDPSVRLLREGYRHNADPDATEPLHFSYVVGQIPERWSDGVTVMHNPLAHHPLDHHLLDGTAQLTYESGELRTWLPDFHVFTSVTYNVQQDP